MPIPPPRKSKPRAPQATAGTPMSSNLPNLSGSIQPQAASPTALDGWDDAYRQLHDRN